MIDYCNQLIALNWYLGQALGAAIGIGIGIVLTLFVQRAEDINRGIHHWLWLKFYYAPVDSQSEKRWLKLLELWETLFRQ